MRSLVRVLFCLLLGLALLPAGRVVSGGKKGDKQPSKGLEGYWMGTLKIGAVDLRVGFAIKAAGEGKFTATLDSPDQGVENIPVSEVEVNPPEVRLEVAKVKGTFKGKLNDAGTEVAGEWQQGKVRVPLTLKRLEKRPVFARPQDPRKPYPYLEEDIVYENKKDKVKLAATLTLPKGDGPFPAVVLITGSGPQDRNETVFAHRPFLVLADHLTRKGVAVLRADDRGVGGSTGSVYKSTSADFADDALAGVEYLKSRKEIDARKIGLLGHSEGGLVAPIVAAKSKDIAFIVLLAGPGMNGAEILYLQGRAILKLSGADEKALARQEVMQKTLFAVIKAEKDSEVARKKITQMVKDLIAGMKEDEKKEAGDLEAKMQAQLEMFLSPWFRYFLTHEPAPVLRQVKCPVLALCGEKDVQVPPRENLSLIEKALKEGGNKDVTVAELKDLNHLFQTCKTGALSEYAQIDETFAPTALERISEWILARVRK
jgi:hypothetical protein